MSNYLLSEDIVMAIDILLDHVKRKLRKKLSKRRENNGNKFKKQV